jgi:hypothetical protein
MNTTKLVLLVVAIAVGLFILVPNLAWAADEAPAYGTEPRTRSGEAGCVVRSQPPKVEVKKDRLFPG